MSPTQSQIVDLLGTLNGYKENMTPTQQQLQQKIEWLRPFTRSAASFSMSTAGWLPTPVRNFPLKVIRRIIAQYQRGLDSGCRKC
jgi:hypothetical protein